MIRTELKPSGLTLYTLVNDNGVEVELIELGATIVSIKIPTKDGNTIDVFLGYDDLSKYNENPCFFGSCVGPIANRTAGAQFLIDGNRYTLPVKEGKNDLHTDFNNGLHKRMFTPVIDFAKNQLCFTIKLDDMEYGLPGNREFRVNYSLTDDNTLEIEYRMITDKKTAINPTNHTYFNLNGHDSGTVMNHIVWIDADKYTHTDAESIPHGECRDVKGTPMDFTTPKALIKDTEADYDQLKWAGGFDHNYCLNNPSLTKPSCTLEDPESGRKMEVYTDLPGMQLYAGNYLDSTHIGKGEVAYDKRYGVCFESQYFPNALNVPEFEQPIAKAGVNAHSSTIYKFV